MRLAWLTDIHLNFLDDAERRRFLETVATQSDAVAISGDIGESPNILGYLKEMEEILRKRIYFVLGNHCCQQQSPGNPQHQRQGSSVAIHRQTSHLNQGYYV